MNSNLGVHRTQGSADGFGLVAQAGVPLLVTFFDSNIDEVKQYHPQTFCVYRPFDLYGQGHSDGPPGYDQWTPDQATAAAHAWWPEIVRRMDEVPQADAYKLTNEWGGNDPRVLQCLYNFETELMKLAKGDYRLVIGNCAVNSPHWGTQLWQRYIVPIIQYAWTNPDMVHLYSRHVYADRIGDKDYLVNGGVPAGDQTDRIFKEIEWLRSHYDWFLPGATILGELGFVDFPGVAHFMQQVAGYDQNLALYNIPGALFTYGNWNNANIEDASAELSKYLQDNPFQTFTPPPPGQQPPPPIGQHKAIILKLPQEPLTVDERQKAYEYIDPKKRSLTYSHDDALRIVTGGNEESYVEIYRPELPSQAQLITLLEAQGLNWTEIRFNGQEHPFGGLRLGRPFAEPYALTSSFDAPRDYGKHEGADYDILSGDPTADVLALYDGIVVRVDSSSGYGNFVVIDHHYDGRRFSTWYAHGDAVHVAVGDVVTVGQPIMEIGSTGNSSSDHVHINLQLHGHGLVGYVIPDVVDPHPYIALSPPPGTGMDMRPYLRPQTADGPRQVWNLLRFGVSYGTQDLQIRVFDGVVHVLKGNEQAAEYETWLLSNGMMRRDIDTSPGNGEFYRQMTTPGVRWADWMPLNWNPGDEFLRNPFVEFYRKADCSPVYGQYEPSYLKFVDVHNTWQPFADAVVFRDVVEVAWTFTPGGDPVESYFFAKEVGGYCGWRSHTSGLFHYCIDLPAGRPPMQPEELPCLSQ